MELSRQYAKLCRERDFVDPAIRELIPAIDPDLSAERPHRKAWEYAMTGLFLRDAGLLRDDARVLDLAAGTEPLIFWLANRVGHVTAADIYGQGDFAYREAAQAFLDDPSTYAPYDYRRDRVTAVDADARELPFGDESFDAVVSMSSIEHFGGPEGIARAAREIGRVLRPGGVAFLVTEVFLKVHPLHRAGTAAWIRRLTGGRRYGAVPTGARPVDGFTADDVERLVVQPSGLRMLQPLDWTADDLGTANVQFLGEAGTTTTKSGNEYPHVVLGVLGTRWTSACLPLVKPA